MLRDCYGAERRFNGYQMANYARFARLRRGELMGGDAGAALVDEASAEVRRSGVADPARMACAFMAPVR